MSNIDPVFLPYFPFPLPVQYVPLPAPYPRLPLGPVELQPVSYTQGNNGIVFVTLLVPLAAHQKLGDDLQIEVIGMPGMVTYQCSISIVIDTSFSDQDQLALTSFAFPSDQALYKVAIEVNIDDEGTSGGGGGRVVMDANMMPTDPENTTT
jgi:hypothetical protein